MNTKHQILALSVAPERRLVSSRMFTPVPLTDTVIGLRFLLAAFVDPNLVEIF